VYACEAIGLIESVGEVGGLPSGPGRCCYRCLCWWSCWCCGRWYCRRCCWWRYWIWVGEDGCGQGQWLGPWLISL